MRFSALFISLALASCGTYVGPPETREYSLDGVKLVVAGDSKPYLASRFLQASYEINPQQRLLLRFEGFSEHSKNVVLQDDRKVMVQVALVDGAQSDAASGSLQLCPLRKDWMMLATWYRAHPFSDSGQWDSPGGDYDPGSCIARSNAPAKDGVPNRLVQFDATQWYKDYPRGRGVNYGFVLIAGEAIQIQGEKSGTFSPRILFDVSQVWIDWRIKTN